MIAGKLIHMDQAKAAGFYAEHEGRPFFPNLVEYMTSAPVFVQVLEGDNAVLKNRELMGATNPSEADPGTIRADFAETIDANAVMDLIQLIARQEKSPIFLMITKSFN